jgi:thiamine pyrophosphate-dependent acetolactate synthase large subunit-like protein
VVVRSLKTQGVDVVFGLPGIHALAIYDGLRAHPEVRQISVRHEQTAVYMADGYARVSNRPGVAILTTGPGTANAAGALGTAWWDSVPVLVVTSNIPSALLGKQKGYLHEPKDQHALLESVTDHADTILRTEDIPRSIHEAFRRMSTGRPRPQAIEITTDMLTRRLDVEAVPWVTGASFRRPQPSPDDIARAADTLSRARRPVIWAGGGVNRAGAERELRQLAERLGAPVVTTVQGAGAFPYDHPLSLGARPTEPAVAELVAQGDVLLAVGTKFAQGMTASWSMHLPGTIVHIDIDPGEFDKNYPAAVKVAGDARAALAGLTEALPATPRAPWTGDLAPFRERVEAHEQERGDVETATLRAIRDAVPREGVIVWDQTKPAYWASRSFPVYQPRTFLYPGFGTLGFAFPTALGAKVAAGGRPVVAVCGDGGFQYALPELATAVQHGIDVITVLFNDNAWGILGDLQDRMFEGRRYAIELANPDFIKLADAYGVRGTRLHGPDGLARAIRHAIDAGGAWLIEVRMAFRAPGR